MGAETRGPGVPPQAKPMCRGGGGGGGGGGVSQS